MIRQTSDYLADKQRNNPHWTNLSTRPSRFYVFFVESNSIWAPPVVYSCCPQECWLW